MVSTEKNTCFSHIATLCQNRITQKFNFQPYFYCFDYHMWALATDIWPKLFYPFMTKQHKHKSFN